MKYLLLVHHNEEAFAKMTETTRREMLAESVQLTHQLHATGQYVSASPLHPTSMAARVQVPEGRAIVTDGPFTETREQTAGYFLVEAQDLQAAIGIALRIPGARLGTVEVRLVREIDGLPET